jgi:hypothetical protein
MSRSSNQAGFALAAAIFALLVLGVLTTSGFYLSRQQSRIGVATRRATEAFYLAEGGAMKVLSQWDGNRFVRLAEWSSASVSGTTPHGSWSADVTRLSNDLFLVRATGTATDGEAVYGGANRRLGIVARVHTPKIDPQAALTTLGDLTVGGRSTVEGADVPPPIWTGLCDPAGPTKPGILIDDLTNVTREGRAHDVYGDPPIAEDNTLTPESVLDFGEFDWDGLVALATLAFPSYHHITQTYPDSILVDGSWICDGSNRLNWGNPLDPGSACGSYFPVIYAKGDLTIDSSDSGQGILLVEKDLTLKGGFQFFGPVIVKGKVLTEGNGGHFNGGLIAANVSLNTSTILGAALVQYSSCAIQRAVFGSAATRAFPLEHRSFVDLSSVVGG